jgi:hypothetical protein
MKLVLLVIISIYMSKSTTLHCSDLSNIIKKLLVFKKEFIIDSFVINENSFKTTYPETIFHNLFNYDTNGDFTSYLLKINKKRNKRLNGKNIILVPYKELEFKLKNKESLYVIFVQSNCIISKEKSSYCINELNEKQLLRKTKLYTIKENFIEENKKENFIEENYPEVESELGSGYESDCESN